MYGQEYGITQFRSQKYDVIHQHPPPRHQQQKTWRESRRRRLRSSDPSWQNWKKVNNQPSVLVTHGEGIIRLILVSQATFGVITAMWWHMHYFETQDEKNGMWFRVYVTKLIVKRGNCDIKARIKTRITITSC